MKRQVVFAVGAALLIGANLAAPVAADTTVNVGCGQSRMRNLISAVRAANRRPTSETTTINLKAGCTYRFYRPQSTRADVGNSALSIQGKVVINGNNATIRRMAGTPEFRLLLVKSGATLELNDVTLVNGKARSGRDGAPAASPTWTGGDGTSGQHGGAIYNLGMVALDGVTLVNNSAGDGGDGGAATSPNAANGAGTDRDGDDAANVTGGNGGQGGHGGAIYNAGSLTAVDTNFTQNTAGDGGMGGAATGGNGGNGADNLAVGTGGKGGNGGAANAGAGGTGGDGGAIYNLWSFFGEGLSIGQNTAGDGGDSVAIGGDGGDGGYDLGLAGAGGAGMAHGGDGGRGGAFAHMYGSFELRSSTIDQSKGGDGGDATAAGGSGGDGGCGSAGGTGGSALTDPGEVGDSNFHDGASSAVLLLVQITNTIGGSAGSQSSTGGANGNAGPTCPGGGIR